LGAPRIDGRDEVGGRDAPVLYFGSTKMNNNFSVVDAVAEEGERGTAATLFVKSGNDPKRTFADFWVLSDPLALRLGLSFEGCDPLAQLDGFELRVHGGGEAGKAGKHRTFT
jgi:hypothetical protein